MRIGLIGPEQEPHCQALKSALASLGAEGLSIDASGFDAERRFGFLDAMPTHLGEPLDDIKAFYLRSVLSPVPEVYVDQDRFVLYEDWHQRYMLAREKHGFMLSWLLALQDSGACLVNPPAHGTMNLLKPHQLARLARAGFPVPRTLVTNDPEEARAFVTAVGRTVCKPVLGGAFCEAVTGETLARLELIRQSPVIFQEALVGPDVRVTAVRGRVLSSVAIESDEIDFRATRAYEQGTEVYTPHPLPKAVSEMCFQAMEWSELYFSGIDLKRVGPDEYVILELNVSPAFLAIEAKTGHAIAEGLARYLLFAAEIAAKGPLPKMAPAPQPRPRFGRDTFFHYGLPKPSQVGR